MASVRLVRGVDVSCGHFWFLFDEAGSFLSGACPGRSYFCRCRTGVWSDRGECESGRVSGLRRGSVTFLGLVADPRRNPDPRFAAEDDGGRGIGAVLAGHDGRRGLCESAMPWLASYV